MVTEIAILRAKNGQEDALRRGLWAARAVISQADGYLGSVFYQGIEEPSSFILRIEWESLDAHMKGFRQSPLLAQWRSHFMEYVEPTPSVTHYEAIAGP